MTYPFGFSYNDFMFSVQQMGGILRPFFSFAKKAIIIGTVFSAILAIFIQVIAKDRPKSNPRPITESRNLLYKEINNPEYKKTTSGKMSVLLLRSATCAFVGEGCTDNPADGDKHFDKSIFGYMSKLVALPYSSPPASGVYWVHSKFQESGFVPKSYAAEGIGFASLKPIMNLWMVFRDIAYLLLVLVLVLIGFMIMFRMKINPQTIISIENALPKIVTSLILITFSFAIAGFLIDAMYVLMSIGISLISDNNSNFDAIKLQNEYMSGNMLTLYNSLFPVKDMSYINQLFMVGDSIMGILPPIINNVVRGFVGSQMAFAFFPGILKAFDSSGFSKILNGLNIVGNSLGQMPESFLGGVGVLVIYFVLGPLLLVHGAGLIVGIMVWFTIIFLMFRIFFLLFRSYLQILIMVIFSPIIMLLEAVPGKSSFSNWFKGLFGELISFPVVAVILALGNVLTNTLSYPGDFWSPPFLYGVDPNAFSVLLGMGLMFLIPDLIKIVKEAIGAKPLPISVGPGTFFSGAGAGMGGGISLLSQFGSIKMGLNALGIGSAQGTGLFGLGKPKDSPSVPGATKSSAASTSGIDPTDKPTG